MTDEPLKIDLPAFGVKDLQAGFAVMSEQMEQGAPPHVAFLLGIAVALSQTHGVELVMVETTFDIADEWPGIQTAKSELGSRLN